MIIGRKNELELLENHIDSNKAEFLVVYGRRRIGKTFLIKHFFKNKFSFYMSGAENASKTEQLHHFNIAINQFSKVPYPAVKNWQDAFVQLRHLLDNAKTKNRLVVFFDELPWLDNAKSGFLSAFEYFWNTYASFNHKIFMIVCGSSTSWLINKIIKNRGGLHNRVTRQIFLKPFTLHETELFLKSKKINYNRYQIAELYMVFGGTPYYLEQLDNKLSLSQNIDKLLFSPKGNLRDEFDKLYHSLFKTPEKYIEVILALAKKRKGMSRDEIVHATKIADGGGLSRILEELEQCEFITINNNFSTLKNKCLYQLSDLYSLFYLSFIKNKRIKDERFWTVNYHTPILTSWRGYAFEQVCMNHSKQVLKKLGISGVITYTASWRSKNNEAQIDFIIDRNDQVINLCEIKFSDTVFSIDKKYDENLRNKRATFIKETKTRKAIHTTIISTYGVKNNTYKNNIQSEVTLNDLFFI